MTLYVIEDESQIQSAQNALSHKLKTNATKNGKILVGYQGGNSEVRAYWFQKYNFWWSYGKVTNESINRHWNAFGIRSNDEEPMWNSTHSHSIICEINFPLSSNTWQVAGKFVKDESGKIYIAHSGKIGGGRKGIGKSAFEKNFSGSDQWDYATDRRGEKSVVIISALNDKNLIPNIAYFTKEALKIKNLAKTGKLNRPPPYLNRNFSPEYMGTRKPYATEGIIQANSTHGRVVNKLQEVAEKLGLNTWNNICTDLFLEGKNRKLAMLEVKTNSNPESQYKAIGQLLYHSKNIDPFQEIMLVAVFPQPVSEEFKKILEKLNIALISYNWGSGEPEFDTSFEKILARLS